MNEVKNQNVRIIATAEPQATTKLNKIIEILAAATTIGFRM